MASRVAHLLRLDYPVLNSLLVAPVRSHAILSDPVHLARPDLNLHGNAIGAQHDCVQGLVAILLLVADVVLEAALHRCPQPVHLERVLLSDATFPIACQRRSGAFIN